MRPQREAARDRGQLVAGADALLAEARREQFAHGGHERGAAGEEDAVDVAARDPAVGKQPVDALEEISSALGWESHPDQTLAVARSIYLRLPEGTKLRDHGKEFTGLKQEAVRPALGAAAP